MPLIDVQDLDREGEVGEMVGYIGPNGAGKSTTVKMLTGILVPTGGTVRVAGLDHVHLDHQKGHYRLRAARSNAEVA